MGEDTKSSFIMKNWLDAGRKLFYSYLSYIPWALCFYSRGTSKRIPKRKAAKPRQNKIESWNATNGLYDDDDEMATQISHLPFLPMNSKLLQAVSLTQTPSKQRTDPLGLARWRDRARNTTTTRSHLQTKRET